MPSWISSPARDASTSFRRRRASASDVPLACASSIRRPQRPPDAVAARRLRPPPRGDVREAEAKPALPTWIFAVLAIAVVGAGGLWFATRPRTPERPTDLAELPKRPPKVVLPDVVDPEVPRRPEKKSEIAPPVAPIVSPPIPLPDDPVTPKATPKARPIDVSALPEIDTPDIKTKHFEIKKIAGVDPEKVSEAIRKGVAFLERTSPDWVTVNMSFNLGVPALGGLALLECGTPPTDPLVQQIAGHVRSQSLNNSMTYEISLAILFFDRLGESRDRGLIQMLAARLIAGQDSSGGWSYNDPILTQPETVQLLAILQQNRLAAARPLVPFTIGADRPPEKGAKGRDPFADPFASSFGDPETETGVRRDPKGDASQTVKMTGDDRPLPPKILPRSRLSGQPAPFVSTTPTPLPILALTQRLQDMPTVRQRDRSRASLEVNLKDSRSDLSNSQFAVLALWAARRHGVVSDRALLLTELRLRKTQKTSGSWTYQEQPNYPENAALTCCGLLGLALGTAADQPHAASLAQALSTDPIIRRALDNLGAQTGDPLPEYGAVGETLDIYALWSTERVAMLYRQPTIRGKDWYGWGAQNLLKNQDKNGSWRDLHGHGHSPQSDTALALLFLVRSNLVQEITDQIRLQMPIQEK